MYPAWPPLGEPDGGVSTRTPTSAIPRGVAVGAGTTPAPGAIQASTENAAVNRRANSEAPATAARVRSDDDGLIDTKGAWAVSMTPNTRRTSVPPT